MAGGTYAKGGGQRQLTSGGLIIGTVSVLSALLVVLALVYASGTGPRHIAALEAAGCEPNLSPSGLQCTTYQALAAQCVGIMDSSTQQINTDAAAYTANDRANMPAAKAALTAEAASEHSFATSMAAFPFPPTVAAMGKVLVGDIQARATLTTEQAAGSSLAKIRSFNHQVQIASTALQTEMKLVRQALATPPPASEG